MRIIAQAAIGLLLVLRHSGLGQQDATNPQPATVDATNRATRLQVRIKELHSLVASAQQAQRRGDLVAASKIYEDALEKTKEIPNGSEKGIELLNDVITTRIQLAEQAQRRGDFPQADAQIMRLMAIAPEDPRVLAFRETNEILKAQAISVVPNGAGRSRADLVKARTLVQKAKIQYESGKWDLAEKQLKEAAQLDPDYSPIHYYLALIHEQRSKREQLKLGK